METEPVKNTIKKKLPATSNNKERLKSDLIKIIRKPGVKEFDEVFVKLKELTGDVPSRKAFVQEIIVEAKKMKKMQLVSLLENFEKAIV